VFEAFLDEYIRAAGLAGEDRSQLFRRSAIGRTDTLGATAMHRVDACRMLQCRVAEMKIAVASLWNSAAMPRQEMEVRVDYNQKRPGPHFPCNEVIKCWNYLAKCK
jgi:hypothetical protein